MWSSLKSFVFTTLSMIPFFAPPIAPAIDFGVKLCVNPAQRKEWRSLSRSDKIEWVRAVKCVTDMPHNASIIATGNEGPPMSLNASFYDDISYVHINLASLVHLTGFFLPWHRNYVHTFEQIMKDHCGYTGTMPYWDWRGDAADLYNSSIMNDPDPETNIGGWGNPAANYALEEGVFAGLEMEYPYPHILRRNFTLYPFLEFGTDFHVIPDRMGNLSLTNEIVKGFVEGYKGNYTEFQKDIERIQGTHMGVHALFGGDMAGICPPDDSDHEGCYKGEFGLFTANDPFFWLHHAMIDKIFTDWQNYDPANKNAFGGGATLMADTTEDYDRYPTGAPPLLNMSSILPSNNLFGKVTIRDVMSTTGGYLCYVYV